MTLLIKGWFFINFFYLVIIMYVLQTYFRKRTKRKSLRNVNQKICFHSLSMERASIKMKTSTGKRSKNEVPWNKGVEKKLHEIYLLA